MHDPAAIPVMIIDDEPHLRITAGQTLELAGYAPAPYSGAEEALAALTPDFPGVVVSDIRMPGVDGMALLREVRQRDPDLPVILITGHGDISTAVEAMREGAWDFLEKDRKSTRLNSSHVRISYAVFCLKKKKTLLNT